MMKDNSPYVSRPSTEIEKERQCLNELFIQAAPISFIYEAFAGVGLAATIWNKLFPETFVESFDLDQDCVDIYNDLLLPRSRAYLGDTLTEFKEMFVPENWAASLDFNKYTIMDLRGRPEGKFKQQLVSLVAERNPKWIHITDSAVRYFHLNWERYGLEVKDFGYYVDAFSIEFKKSYGYEIVHWTNYFAASYFLLERVTK